METEGEILTRKSEVFWGMFEEKETLERSVAARLRYQMQRTKTSIPKLAKAAGCSKDVIQGYSKGKVLEKHMNITWLKRMAEYFGLELVITKKQNISKGQIYR